MKKIWILIVIIIVALLIIFFTTQTKREPCEIKVGVVLSLTGVMAPYGENAKNGVQLAVDEINEKGGIKGKKMRIIYEDDQSDPKMAVSATQKLITQDKVKGVVGFIGSSLLLASAPLFNENEVVLVSPGASSPEIRDAGEYIFRTRASGRLEAISLAEYAVQKLGLKNLAVLYVNNDYGLSWLKKFSEKTEQLLGKIVAKEAYDQGSKDLRSQISKIKASNPDGLLVLGYLDEIAVALRQVKELALNIQILTTVGIQDKKIFNLAPYSTEGVIYSTVDYDPINNAASKKFDEEYSQKYGRSSDVFAANAYDALHLIVKAIANVGNDGEKIKNYLLTIKDYPGAGGTLTFDEKGDVIKPVKIKKIIGEEFREIND
jgi:branched-chain amino acid transport system substrate-binding protein